MKIKMGIIGPRDSVEKICEVAEEFKEKIDVFPYIYEKKEEAIQIVKENQMKVDVILFSGHIPYYITKYNNVIKKPALYIPRVGTSILKSLLEISKQGMDHRRMSIDSVKKESVNEVAKELDLKFEKIYIIPYEENIEYEKLADYHYDLWQKGEINIVVTGLSKTYERLKKLGVPVFKLRPTVFLTREYINKAIYKAKVKRIESTQIAIQIVKIKNRNSNMSSEYNFLQIKNRLENLLIDYTKSIFGSLFPFGRDEYMIFATRGAIDSNLNTSNFHEHINIEKSNNITFASGIGYGNTVYNAEFNARIALDYAMNKENSCIYIVDEEGNIKGPISNKENDFIEYSLSVTDENIKKIAQKINISPAYVSKIQAIIKKSTKDTFDAEEISNYLDISRRSARRILNSIVEANYGQVIATESKSKTGRPRKIYKIDI